MDIYLLIIALGLSFLLHFGIQKIFIYYKKFDDFNHRSSHKTLATRTGGIGIFSILMIISLFYYFQGIELFDYSLFIPLGIMFLVGVYDDFYHADFKLKFFLQIIVAKILIDQGYVISNYYGLFGFYEVPWLIAQLSTVFVFLVVVNAINFIDGIDGLAITEVIKTIFLIEFFSDRSTMLYPLGAIVITCILPLFYFNYRKKKKIFLGDAGSLLLGTLISVYVFYILDPNYNSPKWNFNKTLFSICLIFYPLFDLLRVIFIRIKNNISPFQPDQNHIHHQLQKFTKNHFLTTLIIVLTHLLIFAIYLQFWLK